MTARDSAEIRAGLPHPVVDIDGHMIEYFPALSGFLREEGIDLSSPSMRRLVPGAFGPTVDWHSLSPRGAGATAGAPPAVVGLAGRQHARPRDGDVPVSSCTSGSPSSASTSPWCIRASGSSICTSKTSGSAAPRAAR